MQHRNRFILKTRERRRLPTSSAYITERVCGTVHRALILQNDTNQNECVTIYKNGANITEQYKLERMRYDLQKRSVSPNQNNDKISAVLQQAM